MEEGLGYLAVPSKRELLDRLDRLDLSADAKVLLGKVVDTTVDVGGKVFEIGKRVISFVFDLVKRFRGIAFGVGMALTVSMLVASTPLVGGALSALLTPILVAFGLTMGALEDVRNGALRDSIDKFGADLETAAAHG